MDVSIFCSFLLLLSCFSLFMFTSSTFILSFKFWTSLFIHISITSTFWSNFLTFWSLSVWTSFTSFSICSTFYLNLSTLPLLSVFSFLSNEFSNKSNVRYSHFSSSPFHFSYLLYVINIIVTTKSKKKCIYNHIPPKQKLLYNFCFPHFKIGLTQKPILPVCVTYASNPTNSTI